MGTIKKMKAIREWSVSLFMQVHIPTNHILLFEVFMRKTKILLLPATTWSVKPRASHCVTTSQQYSRTFFLTVLITG